MNYRLAVLTHGGMEPLADTLVSFAEMVTPAPAEMRIYIDGSRPLPTLPLARFPVEGERCLIREAGLRPSGFCAATAALWGWAAEPGVDFVFWLEHDFRFLHPVDLRGLGWVLSTDPHVAQMALVRGPENGDERAAGGLIESRPGECVMRQTQQGNGILGHPHVTHRWLEHRAFFTTNPSLMRREFMASEPFLDDGKPFCEGRYGIGLVEAGYRFGYWGHGEQWVDHVGVRTGHGY